MMVKMITKIDERGLSEAAVSSKRVARSMLKWEREKTQTNKHSNKQTKTKHINITKDKHQKKTGNKKQKKNIVLMSITLDYSVEDKKKCVLISI